MKAPVRTPVAMLVFNRPDTTARVLEAVRAARPARLLVVADGARPSRPGEERRCAEVRALFDRVDWGCEVVRSFSAENLGCRNRVSSGLDWVFRNTEEAIVLEDDCVPDPSFFGYCDELLERYRTEPRVAAITGDNFQQGRVRGDASYYFSRFVHVWGWATWRRAWSQYDVAMRDWPALRDRGWLEELLEDRSAVRAWTDIFDRTHAGLIDTWDFQWVFAVWKQAGLVATPNVNLVTNVGEGADATHTKESSPMLHLPARPIPLPLTHPGDVRRDPDADRYVQDAHFSPSLRSRLAGLLTRVLKAR